MGENMFSVYDGSEFDHPYVWDWDSDDNPLCDFYSCKSLDVWHFNPKSKSFNDLPYATNLQQLSIKWTNSINFKGLEKYSNLVSLELYYCANINSLEGIDNLSNSLTLLGVFNAKKINDFSLVKSLSNLETLRMCYCGNIKSLSFILDMPNLRSISFVGSNIVDGNISPLLLHSPKLEFVGFNNKKHYSHTCSDIKKQLNIL